MKTPSRQLLSKALNNFGKVCVAAIKNERFDRPELLDIAEEVESLIRRTSNMKTTGTRANDYAYFMYEKSQSFLQYVKTKEDSDEFVDVIMKTPMGLMVNKDCIRARNLTPTK